MKLKEHLQIHLDQVRPKSSLVTVHNKVSMAKIHAIDDIEPPLHGKLP